MGSFNEVAVHESVKVNGKVSKLRNHMIHLAYEDVFEFINKQKHYANLSEKKKNIYKAILTPSAVGATLFQFSSSKQENIFQ